MDSLKAAGNLFQTGGTEKMKVCTLAEISNNGKE